MPVSGGPLPKKKEPQAGHLGLSQRTMKKLFDLPGMRGEDSLGTDTTLHPFHLVPLTSNKFRLRARPEKG
jgi:hypothetical protein